MGSRWATVSLPPAPIRPPSPERRAETAAAFDAELARYLHGVEIRERRRGRTTPEQRRRKAAQDDTRKLRALLHEAAEASRWARIETALDGLTAFESRAKADNIRAKVEQRTRRLYERAADGCEIAAAYLADDSLDPLYAEMFQPVNRS